ncbi:MAG TPA: hypothetical protein VJ719_06560, partial [Chthoniobacterales bacterium]|nr:hypothetical protein [Chthoniobacterales bacterium]
MRATLVSFSVLLLLFKAAAGSPVPTMAHPPQTLNAGPDVITGDLYQLEQFGFLGTQVGLAVATGICNAGNVEVNFRALPDTNHPVIPQNLYRMSGGSGNDERFEQIGQSWAKHTFGTGNGNECNFGCAGGNFNLLGVGCSDAYDAGQNATATDLGSRTLINPFTGIFQATANNHADHVHTNTSHLVVVESADLNTTVNPGATYYAEVQYLAPDEYAWCQTHPGQCNMYNNASYRRYDVTGTSNFTFAPVGETVRMAPALNAWPGATINAIEPEPGVDGR